MLAGLKKSLYFRKMYLLFNQGVADKKIIPFDDNFYEKMNHTYISCIPVSMHIKYLKPTAPPGKCYDRSLFMFFCFENAVLVRADSKDLELRYGKDCAGHGWIEIDNYVYDPSLMMRFDKDLYYKIYMPTNISKSTKEEYCQIGDNKKFYDDVVQTTISDYQINGSKRTDLITIIPLLSSIAKMSGNQDFIREFNEHLSLIQYDEYQISEELKFKLKTYC